MTQLHLWQKNEFPISIKSASKIAVPTKPNPIEQLMPQMPAKPEKHLPVLEQIQTAYAKRFAFVVGAIFGGFVPLAVWNLVHKEPLTPVIISLITGGSLFSSLSVMVWARSVFGGWTKGISFALLIEGVMLFPQAQWLSITSLALLILINAMAAAVNLVLESHQRRNTGSFK